MPVQDRPETVESRDRSQPDLQRRLEHLPPDHPSSPYQADGTRKPPEPSLRDLELPFPDDEEFKAREADTPRRDYWSEVPRFQEMWAEHARGWPEQRVKVHLSPEQDAQAKKAIADTHRTEPSITDYLQQAEYQNTNGGRLVGLEHRRKGEERLKEKIASELSITPDMSPAEALEGINDAIRYTFCFESEKYTSGYYDVRRCLEGHGFEIFFSKNHWSEAEYKGINTRWITPDGQRFEVQFHTPESFHAKQEVTHEAYERARNPLTTRPELEELEAFQREVSSWIPVPDDALDIPDYRRDDR